jgi:hypothetical protein
MKEIFFNYIRSKLTIPDQELPQLESHLKTKHLEKRQVLISSGKLCLYGVLF